MRVPRHIVEARREKLADLLRTHQYLPVRELCRLLKISEATARRDLAALEGNRQITRTYGGALVEFDQRFPSFAQRRRQDAEAKASIAAAAAKLVKSGMTVFFDSGTTTHAVAEQLVHLEFESLRVVTSNLPAADALVLNPRIEVFLLGGRLLQRQSVLLGDVATRSAQTWSFDIAFLSAEGLTTEGLWNTSSDIVALQRAVLSRATTSAFCCHAGKIGHRTQHFLARWNEIGVLVTDAPKRVLAAAEIRPPRIQPARH